MITEICKLKNTLKYNKTIEKVFIVQKLSKEVFYSQISLYGFISEMIPTPKFFPKQFNELYYTQPKKGKNRKKCRKKSRGQIKFQLNLTQHK
jgi:hypothetical protein